MIKVEKETVLKWVADRLSIERGYSNLPKVKMLEDGSIVVVQNEEQPSEDLYAIGYEGKDGEWHFTHGPFKELSECIEVWSETKWRILSINSKRPPIVLFEPDELELGWVSIKEK